MKTNSKLTLKQLKQELDLMKARSAKSNKSSDPTAVGHDIKQSYIQNLHNGQSFLCIKYHILVK